MTFQDLRGCVAGQWSPGIGDPGLAGWLTVLTYAACAVLAIMVWQRLKGHRGRTFWGILMLLLTALAVNKQLDLQSALTAAGKCLAHEGGWYDQRRTVQAVFIAALLGGTVATLAAIVVSLRGRLRQNLGAVLGIVLVSSFVLIRAASFHHVDYLIGGTSGGISNNFLFENAGLVLIALNAAWLLRRRYRLEPA